MNLSIRGENAEGGRTKYYPAFGLYKAFRHVETSFVQGNQVRTDQDKPLFLVIKKEGCFDQYELNYLGRIKFLHVEIPYYSNINLPDIHEHRKQHSQQKVMSVVGSFFLQFFYLHESIKRSSITGPYSFRT